MGIVVRQSFWGTVSAYLGTGVGYINAIILLPLWMNLEEIGLWRTILSAGTFLASFGILGIPGAVMKFFPGFSEKEKRQFISLNILFLSLGFTILTFIGHIFKKEIIILFNDSSQALSPYYSIIYLLLSLILISTYLQGILNTYLNISISGLLVNIVQKLLHTAIIVLFGLGFISFDGYVWGNIINYAIINIVMLFVLIKRDQLGWDWHFHFRIEQYKEFGNFILFSTMSAASFIFVLEMDKLMVSSYLGLNSNAIYTTALLIALVIQIPSQSISKMITPIISQHLKSNDIESIDKLYKQTSKNQFILGSFIFLLIVLNLDQMYQLMPKGNEFREGFLVVVIIGVSRLIQMLFNVSSSIISMSSLYRQRFTTTLILGLAAWSLNLLLIPKIGMIGAAIATLLSYLIFDTSRLIIVYDKFKIHPFDKHTVTILLLGLFTFTIGTLIPQFQYPIISIMLNSTVISIIYLGGLIIIKPSQEINQIFLKISENYLNKLLK
ncbi:lipopolysaccharide biosynthesis protein [Marinoscillum sp. MHG1-6]|uniref:lipopolysaccharide biosynthesis protein n=1 Tax=Marinoscillum sp. MHG1-6 TaxID=2959627 RepID=UPI0021579F05|nr:polysaccharide biosynthesis C-terminal domain-containing protein [Marinoscillum sp. MHG1-6]